MNMKPVLFGMILAGAFALSACEPTNTADTQQRKQQEKISEQGNMVVGMPAITHFFEKRMMKTILEMRDDPNLATYTYTTDLNGRLHFRCHSIGYGLPYSTQYTNPSKISSEYGVNSNAHYVGGVIPQADPNGLFSPTSSEGTWVLCKNPKTNDIAPAYIETRIETYQWPMEADPQP